MKNKIEVKMMVVAAAAAKSATTQARLEFKKSNAPGPARGYELVRMWWTCRDAKDEARFVQLAYALVRGRSYWRTERKVNEEKRLLSGDFNRIAALAEVDPEAVKAWVEAPVSSEETEAWSAHLSAAEEARRAGAAVRKAARAA